MKYMMYTAKLILSWKWNKNSFQNLLSGLWRTHKESLASKQPVSSTEYQWMNFESIFEEKKRSHFSRLQHFHNWGRRLWRPALIAMVEVVEQQSSNLALWADGACPWHPDTPRYTQWVIISADHFYYLLICRAWPSTKINTCTLQGNKSFKNPPNIWTTYLDEKLKPNTRPQNELTFSQTRLLCERDCNWQNTVLTIICPMKVWEN